jgi:competence protein ComEC
MGLGAGNTLENNASIVLRLVYGGHSFLFMGDAEGKDRDDTADRPRYVEKILLETVPPDRLKSTVLKLGHHGSETSSTLPFLRAVDPEIVLVSSGRKRFGRTFIPDASTLARYCAYNPSVRIYRTDQDDAAEGRDTRNDADGDHVVLRSNGTVLQVKARSGGRAVVRAGC